MGAGAQTDPRLNRVLRSLPEDVWTLWEPVLERVELAANEPLTKHRRSHPHVYFPVTAVVALSVELRDGGCTQVALAGYEGLVGMSALTGRAGGPLRAVAQMPGIAMKLPSEMFLAEFFRGGALARYLVNYMQALVSQTAQTAVCNRHHAQDQQLCRLLLQVLDRTHGSDLAITHAALSQMLGVRRESVTLAARQLQDQGVIRYRRGHIHVVDRQGLAANACECYAVLRHEFEALVQIPK